ncbi:MAG: immunoglobulin domain-containing protein, partial [Sediminibacterium sp.]|nr:immunoglobulin domain-containing protein [Sediminibacterium sp.]
VNNGSNITNISDSFRISVTENVTFNVNFIIKSFKLVSINASQASFGVITPSLSTVNAGADATLTITPSAGYKVDSIFRFNGSNPTKNYLIYNNSNSFTISNITDSTTIYVKFIIIPASLPVISVQPISQNITIPINTVTFTVTASVQDNGTLSYQWYKKGKNDADFSIIPNATNSEFIVSNPINSDSGTLLKVSIKNTVNNGAGNLIESVFSSEALLRIFNLPTKPIVGTVTRNPSGTITENNDVTFYVAASKNDGGELTYYWQYKLKNTEVWENYNNYIYTANLNIPHTNYKYNGASFRVIVHNTINNVFDSAVSNTVILDMASIAEIAGKVLGGVAGGVIGGGVILAGAGGIGYGLYGGGGVFGATTTTGVDIIGFEGSLLGIEGADFIPILGETTVPIIFSTGTLGAIVGGTIGVAVIVGGVGVGIAAGVVYGNDPGTGYDSPAITFQPQNTYQKTGYSLTFLVRAGANLADRISYQWQSSTDGINFTNIPNATDSNYITPVLTLSDNEKKYRVIVTAHYGNTTISRISNTATAYITNTNKYIINTLASGGGTISPSTELAAGVYGYVQFAPNPGFEVDKIIVDNVVVLTNAAGRTSYQFDNLSASHTIVVTFKAIIYTIAVNTRNNLGQVQTYSFTALANSTIRIPYTTLNGYLFKNVEVNNYRYPSTFYPDSTNGITFTLINNTTVNVNFIVKNYALKQYFNDVLVRVDSFPYNTRKLRANFN